MTLEALLFWIMVGTLITSIINVVEIISLIMNTRRTNQYLENIGLLASDGFFQFITDIANDKKKEAAFFGFVHLCGQHAISAGKEAMQQKIPKIKSLSEAIGYVLQLPSVRRKIEKSMGEVVGETGEQVIEASEAVAAWGGK